MGAGGAGHGGGSVRSGCGVLDGDDDGPRPRVGRRRPRRLCRGPRSLNWAKAQAGKLRRRKVSFQWMIMSVVAPVPLSHFLPLTLTFIWKGFKKKKKKKKKKKHSVRTIVTVFFKILNFFSRS